MMDQNHSDPQQLTQGTSSQLVEPIQDKKPSSAAPKGRRKPRKKEVKGPFYLSDLVELRTYLLVHSLGYSFLMFALVDYLHIVIPLRLTDPVWEFQTIGALVEQAAVPLLGLMFIFCRQRGYLKRQEKQLLAFLSWFSLLLGLLYLLMLPLAVGDTLRIYQNTNNQIAAQLSQQLQQAQQIKGQLNQATTNEQIKNLVGSLNPQFSSAEIKNPQAFKDQFITQVSQAEQSMQTQARTMQKNQKVTLIKNSVKWNLGALITAVLFIWIWHVTRWVRKKELK